MKRQTKAEIMAEIARMKASGEWDIELTAMKQRLREVRVRHGLPPEPTEEEKRELNEYLQALRERRLRWN